MRYATLPEKIVDEIRTWAFLHLESQEGYFETNAYNSYVRDCQDKGVPAISKKFFTVIMKWQGFLCVPRNSVRGIAGFKYSR